MKFCHLLQTSSQEVPEYRNLFLFYKQMKKQLKFLPKGGANGAPEGTSFSEAEARFAQLLVNQINGLNTFRVQRQEACATSLTRLQSEAQSSASIEERQQAYKNLVNFHGETLLLMHWSILAYTAIVKLLKKHHKHTGCLVQAPHLRDVLSQPCWSTEVMTNLITAAEALISKLQVELYAEQASAEQAAGAGGADAAGTSNPAPAQHTHAPDRSGEGTSRGVAVAAAGAVALPSGAVAMDEGAAGGPVGPGNKASSTASPQTLLLDHLNSLNDPEDEDSEEEEEEEEEGGGDGMDWDAMSMSSGYHPEGRNMASASNSTAHTGGTGSSGAGGSGAHRLSGSGSRPERQGSNGAGGALDAAMAAVGAVGGGPRASPVPTGTAQPSDAVAGSLHNASGSASGSVNAQEPYVHPTLMHQMQMALQTWEYLQTYSSTPSTVLPNGMQPEQWAGQAAAGAGPGGPVALPGTLAPQPPP